MSFAQFTRTVKSRFGNAAKVKHEDGKHIAYLPEGVKIIGILSSEKVTVKWGDNHVAIATF